MKPILIAMLAAALAFGCSKDKDNKQTTEQPAAEKPADKPDTKPDVKPPDPGAAKAIAAAPKPADGDLGVAPDFKLKDLDGKEVSLSQFKGKTVVLEWFNPGCPFVKYAHEEGPLKGQAGTTVNDSTVWLAVNSGAPNKQGHGVEVNKTATKTWSMNHPVLVDESGEVGKAYGAKTTPHMYVINPEGKLVYRGAIDNAPLGNVDGGDSVKNYVSNALAALAAGKAIDPAETKAYGCSVKYAN